MLVKASHFSSFMTPIFLSAAKENFSENQAKTYPSHGGLYSSDCSYRVERQKDQKKGLPTDRATSQPTNLNG